MLQLESSDNQLIKKEKYVVSHLCIFATLIGVVHPCMLDWSNQLVIGDAKTDSAKDIWNGKKLRDLRIAMTRGERDKIDVCKNCDALTVCMDDDLDSHKDKIYKVYNVSKDEIYGENQWIKNRDNDEPKKEYVLNYRS